MLNVNGNEKQDSINIVCDGTSSASISLIGDSDYANGVIVNMGEGLSSMLSTSIDRVT